MSSSRRPRTLRAKLVIGQAVLLAALVVVIGFISAFVLRGFLVRDLDKQMDNFNRVGIHDDRQPERRMRPGITAMIYPDGSVAGVWAVPPDPTAHQLTADEAAVLKDVRQDGKGETVTVGGLGEYRVISDGIRISGLPLKSVSDTMWQMGTLLLLLTIAGTCIAALVGRVVIRRTLKPLDDMAATATRVSEIPLHEGEVALAERVPDTDPHTEVGQVGLALNRMLGHVDNALKSRQASETRVRQFVADASHELRTPLAAIRGYAELTRRTNEELPEDVKHAMGRVESEAKRMTSLVEDLLLLARIDAGRPLESEPVDLSRLVIDVVGDARIAGRDHNWKLELPEEPVTVRGDVQRLHQVLGNLLGNARTHTPPGTTVITGVNVHNGHVELTVTDDGPGIPDGLEVFERFARGDSSRSRAAGSTGLGLSIVSAVVSAHGGSVAVDSEPGRTRFTVRLGSASA